MGIDKDSFVSVLLNGYGYPAVGVFPDTFSFGGQNLTTESYDPDGAKKVLEEAGWVDSDVTVSVKKTDRNWRSAGLLIPAVRSFRFLQSLHRQP